MLLLVAAVAQGDQVIRVVSQIRTLIGVLDVVYLSRFGQLSVSSAVLALVSVPPQDLLPQVVPPRCVVIKCHSCK